MKNNSRIYIYTILIILIAVSIFAIYKNRADGNLIIHIPNQDLSLIINNEEHSINNIDEFSIKLSPGQHSILLTNENLWPWKKDIYIQRDETINLYPFLTSKEARGEILEKDSEKYLKALEKIQNELSPTKENPKKSKDETISIWKEENTIVARWNDTQKDIPDWMCVNNTCELSKTVVNLDTGEIYGVDFYKNKNKVIIFGIDNAIYAIEIDNRSIQNFQPIYISTEKAKFSIDEDGEKVYVQDGEDIVEIIL